METACLRQRGKNQRSVQRLVGESADRQADEMQRHAREIEAARDASSIRHGVCQN